MPEGGAAEPKWQGKLITQEKDLSSNIPPFLFWSDTNYQACQQLSGSARDRPDVNV